MGKIDKLISIAEKYGFEQYYSFNEDDQHIHVGKGNQHDILTCLKGEYDGEVIDIYWNMYTGEIQKIEHSCQRKGQVAKFKYA